MAKLTVREKLQITSTDLALRKKWLDLTEEEVDLIKACKEFLAPQAEEIASEFYEFGFGFHPLYPILEVFKAGKCI